MDHSRFNIHQSTASCGLLEFSNLSDDIEGAVFQLASYLYHPSRGNPATFVLLSDLANETTNSSKFINFMENNKLANFRNSSQEENPKTGNIILVWVGSIDHKNFKEYYKNQRILRIQRS